MLSAVDRARPVRRERGRDRDIGAGLVSLAVGRPAMVFTVLALIAGVGCLGLAVEDLLPGFVEPLSAGMAGIGVPMFFLTVARYSGAGGDNQVAP